LQPAAHPRRARCRGRHGSHQGSVAQTANGGHSHRRRRHRAEGRRIGERFKDGVHVNVTSYNRMVLLTGEVPDAAARTEAERITWAVENVRGVHNEMAVAGMSSYTVRSNDAVITSKVKGRFLDSQKFNPLHVKVVTENSIVYLMGLVKKQEANEATEIARTTSGVQKVVRVFEYLD
jgi:osmotically-inducible protein OsmY